MKAYLILIFFLFVETIGFSQSHFHSIKGYLVNNQEPIEFGYVIVRNAADTTSIIGTAITDNEGFFKVKLSESFSYPLKLTIDFQHISFEDKQLFVEVKDETMKEIKLNKVSLLFKASDLDELTIIAQRKLVEREGSKLIYNISQDKYSKGKNLESILNALPGVNIAPDGTLKLLGSSNVKVLIDGKDSKISNDELKNMLKSYGSELIQSIEVITSPSAEYDATFAKVININTRKDYRGLASVTNLNYEQTIAPKAYFSNYTTYNSHKFNFSTNLTYGNSRDYEFSEFNRLGLKNGAKTRITQSNDIKIISKSYNIGGDLTYKINERNNLSGSVKYRRHKEGIPRSGTSNFGANSNNIDSLIETHSDSKNNLGSIFYQLNFETLFGRDSALNKLSLEYNRANYNIPSSLNNTSLFSYKNEVSNNKEFTLLTDITSKLYFDIGRLDYTPHFGKKIGLVIGGKISKISYKSDFNFMPNKMSAWVLDSVDYNQYKYNEINIAGYFKFNYGFKDWTLNGGLRMENTNLSNRTDISDGYLVDSTYINWFPSVSLWNKINDQNEMGFNFTKRITRPSYQDLDPTFFVLDPYSYLQGNLLLKPEVSTVYEFVYILKQNHLLSLSVTRNANAIIQTPTQFSNVLRLQPHNYREATSIDLFLSTPINISKWWKINPEYAVYKRSYTSSFNQGKVKNSNYSYYISVNNDFALPKDFLVNFNFFFQGPDIAGIYQIDKFYTFSLNVRKAFLEDKLNLSLSLRDVLKSYKIKNYVNDLHQDLKINQTFDSRVLAFNVSYTFRKGKEITSSKKEFNEEEFNRIK